ncbi:MAG: TonB-dependent receptor, partial [Candidatus Acidiferrales bacterium]
MVGVLFIAGSARAQFTANIQGTVADPSGATVAQAKVTLLNTATQVSQDTTTDASGLYRFVSVAPGPYQVSVAAAGFETAQRTVTVTTDQDLNVTFSLTVGAASQSVVVTSESPILSTTDTRDQQTVATQELSSVPLEGRNMLSLSTEAPGVSGLGVASGPGTNGGTPGSSADNFSTEEGVDVSAKGQGTVSNLWVIDGLDVTSGIRQGVLNLTPNPDFVEEASNQVNIYSAAYGNASGIQFAMTTKSGSDQFHFLVSDYFNNQDMWARFSLPGDDHAYSPFHGNNMSFSVGGPVIPHKRFFFFFGVEPLRESTSTGGENFNFVDPAFIAFAKANFPNNLGTQVLENFPVSPAVAFSSVFLTAANDTHLADGCGPTATLDADIPCSTNLVDTGIFNSTNFRNGTQYFLRFDKYFDKDRIYGSFFRTLLATGGPAAIPAFPANDNYFQRALQIGWTHTFSPTMLNEASFGSNRVQGIEDQTGTFTVPIISTPEVGGYGSGFAQGNFIQHDYHWRDVLTKVTGAHVFTVGYEGWYGDDEEPFQGPWSTPAINFNSLLDLVQDAPQSENHLYYSPQTGNVQLWDWDAASSTYGFFANDTWKARKNLTLTLGFRFDNEGNPYSLNSFTVFGNFILGQGSSFDQQIANGSTQASHYALNHAPKSYNPRIGLAWDVTGSGNWLLRGGFGMFSNALTAANIQEEFRGDTPGTLQPTFEAGSSTPPIFSLGTGSTPPFGFVTPSIVGGPLCPAAPCLDSQGGLVGANLGIGGIDPNINSPTSYQWSGTLEHKISNHFVASVLWSGSHNTNIAAGGDAAGGVSYGTNINFVPGSEEGKSIGAFPGVYNTSFGGISYTQDNRYSNYEGVSFDLRGRAKNGFFDVSYTRSSSKDDAGVYPGNPEDPSQYYGPSPWDVPNRLSVSFTYTLTGLKHGQGAVGKLTGGWGLSGVSYYQTGYPFTVFGGN